MDELKQYNIAFKSLADGVHHFNLTVGRALFESIESSLINDGNLTADVELTKNEHMLKLHFSIRGTIRVACDICLGEFDYPIDDCGGDIVVKFGDEYEELSEELVVIPESDNEINVGQWIYEFICVAMPIRFVHPLDADGNSTCDPEMVERLNQYLVTEKTDTDTAKSDDGSTDPRWDALKELIDKHK